GVPALDIDPFSHAFLTNPYPGYDQMREAGPLVWLSQYGIYATTRHTEVRTVMSDHANYISSAGVGLANFNKEPPFRPKSLILEADPPSHTKVRAVLARILSPKAVSQIRESFSVEADRLFDALVQRAARGEMVDGVKDLAEPYPLKVFPDAVGLDALGRENLLLYGDMIFNSFGPRNDLLARATTRVGPVTAWIMAHCQRSMLRPGGFGDLIYQAADTGEITQEEAPLLVRSFLSAGVDTTVNGIGNALLCLAQNPAQYAKLRAEPRLARYAFEEALRLESAVQLFFRTTAQEVALAGHSIPAGSKVLAFLGGANRDARQWPHPTQFDIDRKPLGHMAFGSGIHGCVGQVVARLEGELILTALAKRVERIELAGEPVRRLNNTLRAMASMPLRLTPV
ncbi:MAG: cytochrome P450, partial [Burkholderiaceae bacterium]